MPRKKAAQKQTLLKRLLERRLPQIIFIYFGVCWTILEFLSWLVEHYQISPHLTDLGLIVLLSMLPTVSMLAYFHGKPGRDEWTRTEKIGIPLNILFTGIMIFIIFSGQELGSATTQVTVRNDLGQMIKRRVPAGEFNRRVAIFFFRNQAGQTQFDWLQSAFMAGCHLDLSQDPVFSLYSASDNVIYQKILKTGLTNSAGLPMTLERKIATEIQREYFLGGSFTTAGDTFIVSTYLYETGNGKLIAEHSYRDKDFCVVIDRITRELKTDLGLPVWHIEQTEDLPVKALLTNDPIAARAYFLGCDLVNLKNNYQDATPYFERAVHLDPTFTLAYWMLYACYVNFHQSAQALTALQTAMQHLYKVPELTRLVIKQEYYQVTENPDKRFAVLEMWVKLYPRDVRGHFSLAAEYLKRNEPDKVIAEYNTIMQLDPSRRYYLQYIGDIYLTSGDFKNALKYFTQYQQDFPGDYQAFTALGNLYFTMGNYTTAQQYYTDALALEPAAITAAIQLCNIALETGESESALDDLHKALRQARTANERSQVYEALQHYYERTGQIRAAFRARDDKFQAQAEFLNPATVAINRIFDGSLNCYFSIGDAGGAGRYLNQIENQLAAPWNKLVSVGFAEFYIAAGKTAPAETAADKFADAIRIFSSYHQSDRLHHLRGQICELKSDYLGAILEYQQELNIKPTAVTVMIDIARCYRLAGDPAKARSLLTTTLKVLPFHPAAHLEMAEIYQALGDPAAAAMHVQNALKIWSNADREFEPASIARQLASRLQKSIS